MVTACVARMYRFALRVCVSVHLSVQARVSGLVAHLTDFVQLLITFKHWWIVLTL